MDQPQSAHTHSTALNRKKKTYLKPPSNPSIPERQDQSVVQDEVDTETHLLIYSGGATHEETNTYDEDSEEDVVRPLQGRLVDMFILRSFRTHVAYFVSKVEVNLIISNAKLSYYVA